MSAGLFAIGLEFAAGGYILAAALLVVLVPVALVFWLVLRPDPPERTRDNEPGDGW